MSGTMTGTGCTNTSSSTSLDETVLIDTLSLCLIYSQHRDHEADLVSEIVCPLRGVVQWLHRQHTDILTEALDRTALRDALLPLIQTADYDEALGPILSDIVAVMTHSITEVVPDPLEFIASAVSIKNLQRFIVGSMLHLSARQVAQAITSLLPQAIVNKLKSFALTYWCMSSLGDSNPAPILDKVLEHVLPARPGECTCIMHDVVSS